MDGAIRWPLGPVGAALATGAFFAFLAYWKRRPKPQERHIQEIPNVEDSLLTNDLLDNQLPDSESLRTSEDTSQCLAESGSYRATELTESPERHIVEPIAHNSRWNCERKSGENDSLASSSFLFERDVQGTDSSNQKPDRFEERKTFNSYSEPESKGRFKETAELSDSTKTNIRNHEKQNELSPLKKRYFEEPNVGIQLASNPKTFKQNYFFRNFQGFHLKNPIFFERTIQRSDTMRSGPFSVSDSNTSQKSPKLSVDIEIKRASIGSGQNIADRPITRAAIEMCLRNALIALLSENRSLNETACKNVEDKVPKISINDFSNLTESHEAVLEENNKIIDPLANSSSEGKRNLIEEEINMQCLPLTIKETNELRKCEFSGTSTENAEENLVNEQCSQTLDTRKFEQEDKQEVSNDEITNAVTRMNEKLTTKLCETNEINSNGAEISSKTEHILYEKNAENIFDNRNLNVSEKAEMEEFFSPVRKKGEIIERKMECEVEERKTKEKLIHPQSSFSDSHDKEIYSDQAYFSTNDNSILKTKPLLLMKESTVEGNNIEFMTACESATNEICKGTALVSLPEDSAETNGKQIENEIKFHEKSNLVDACQEDESSSSDVTVIYEPIPKKEKILNDEAEKKICNSLLDYNVVDENSSREPSFYVENNINFLSTFEEKSHPNSSKTMIDFTHTENSAKCQKGIEDGNKTSVNGKAGETETTTEVADIRSVEGRKNANEINFRNARKKLDRFQKRRLEKFRVLFRRRKVSKQPKGENETHAGVLLDDEKKNCGSGEIEIREKLANFQGKESVSGEEKSPKDGKNGKLSLTLKLGIEKCSRVIAPDRDVRGVVTSRTRAVTDAARKQDKRQMDRERRIETRVRTDGSVVSTAVVSRCSFDDRWDWDDALTVRTVVSEEFSPTLGEFVPGVAMASDEKEQREEIVQPDAVDFDARDENVVDCGARDKSEREDARNESELPSSPRLRGLLSRDEERRSRRRPASEDQQDQEWERILRGVLASVHELESWEGRRRGADVRDAEEQPPEHPPQSGPGAEMEASPPAKGETPTKVKSLRFKLDPDVFDVPSDDSFYDDENEDSRSWRRPQQTRYKAFSSLDLGRSDEPVRLVSVQASVVPAGQKMVARPMGIDLRVRLTEERQSKRAHVGTSPSQAKRRSPVSDGWCQELSPVTENVDWRETFTTVEEPKVIVPNGILKTPSPKTTPEDAKGSPKSGDSSFQIKSNKVEVSNNPFKSMADDATKSSNEKKDNVPTSAVQKPKVPWKPPHLEKKPFLLPRKKFEPDPEAIERITGYKVALSKPPLPPPMFHKVSAVPMRISKAELARRQYLDSKAQLAKGGADGAKKFQQFLQQAQSDRARIGNSVPDLCAIEKAVVEQWAREKNSASSPRESPAREEEFKQNESISSRGSTPDDAWASYVQSCRRYFGRRSQSMSYLETDVDIVPNLEEVDKCYSVSALNEEVPSAPDDSDMDQSREDLDDSGRAKSEHELRVERSLRSLPLPDWYKKSDKPKSGFILSSSKEKRGWAAAKSLTSSTSSLASCGLRRPTTVRSLLSSREDIPWSSPDGPTLSLALAKAFREPYLGWRRARTPTSSGVSSSPRGASPPSSWGAATTTDEDEVQVSFDGEDAFIGRTSSLSEDDHRKKIDPPSLDDTGADVATVSMDTGDPVKLPGGEDTCEDINNMSMDTCEMFDADDRVDDDAPSATADTGDDIDNLSTDTTDNKECKDISRDCYDTTQSFSKEYNDTTKDSKEILKDLSKNHVEKVKDFSKDDEDNSKNSNVCENNNSNDSSVIYSNDVSQNYSKDTTKSHNEDISQNFTNVISQNLSNGTSYSYSKNYNGRDTSNSSKAKDRMKDSKLKDSNKLKRYSYSQSIYHSEWDDEEESRGDRKGVRSASPSPDGHKIIWIESSFVGSRTTTSIVVLPQDNTSSLSGNVIERPASR